MIEVAQASVTIIPTMKGSRQKITKDLSSMADPAAGEAGESSGGEFSSKFSKAITNGSKAIMKGVGVAAAAAGAMIANTTKEAVTAFADYEQLVGGVDTLFKDSSEKVQEYAQNAYMTSGMSANKYMETVTSFSAALMKSLKGDTDKAADVADMAMRDMSDNANKMGTDMESIQSAYMGFSKQNYTMLDNLNEMGALAA